MNVLIIGLGSIARKHIKAIHKLDSTATIYALRRKNSVKNEEGVINIFDLDMLPALDCVIISNPTDEHRRTLEQISELEIPIFIEKPLFDSLIGNEELVRKIIDKEIPSYVACNLRFLDCLSFTKKFIENKRLNEVNVYCGSYLPNWRPEVDFREIYSANKDMGGGVHIDLIHEIDYSVWLFGLPSVVRKEFTNNSSLDISAFDYANYLFRYDRFSVNIILNYYRKSPKRSLEVLCEEGELLVDLLKNEVSWNGKLIFKSQQTIVDTYHLQMDYFMKNVVERKLTKAENNIVEAYHILKLCLEN